ncbi:flagellar basal body P-ring formation chaperone FlgA [Ferrovum myxofaciens]|uniref:Flagella basal body P-ring formation protein FlgA n=2 Tax=root TaxID=1 RepID=A0A859A9C0_9PROT|nr:flagellar basal body P-ring formation chaperone FlgA [Ferrovum myxofaciens]NDU88777.1 flagellar basal body P-ring formation protein FlgA [Ferrovum sp.]KXW57664.1 flagella basal body P-ring formation protein FlgA precursor [Ferrovum myxofaciens]MBU6994690.1 flagellar basal body P-ring formation protein FlgA [Ferrovum myxofaciens]QKE38541.1 MAG: flagellar basal body P-ring formation protein FlgA [Ferrovum myxofaciens]QKE41077.1 MAG: flagellar basal body P-ring formation protein FlgA [Ferrovum
MAKWMRMGLLSLVLVTGQSWADTAETLVVAIRHFVESQWAGNQGELSVVVEHPTYGQWPEHCPSPQLSLPPGVRPEGRFMVALRCANETDGSVWSRMVPVRVILTADYYVARHPLMRDTPLNETDFEIRHGVLDHSGAVTRQTDLTGKVLRQGLNAGQVLREDMMREAYVVQQGQTVQVQVVGDGFKISTDGQALNNAALGQNVQVRTVTGKMLSGTAQENGMVRVNPGN